MTRFPPPLFCLVAGMIALLPPASAQTPAAPPPAAKTDAPVPDNNYVLTLYTPADKKSGSEMAIVLALLPFDQVRSETETSATFDMAYTGQPHLHFRGTLIPQKDGRYLLNYFLEGSGDSASAGLLLRPGEPVQMIKNGDLYFNLRLERYSNPVLR